MNPPPHHKEHGHRRGRVAWLAAAAVGSLALAAVVSLAALSTSASRAVRAKYDRIAVGMTEGEVEALLGYSDDHHLGHAGCLGVSLLSYRPSDTWTKYWSFDDYIVTVEFHQGVVGKKSIKPVPRTWLERLKALWDAIVAPLGR
jgi:hypothetical protein